MVSHVVLMKPRPELTAAERHAFVEAFEEAIRRIPTVRAVRVGKRITFGAGYESAAPDAADFLAVIDFDDLAGLQTYLSHPAHVPLGKLFGTCLQSALVYDYETGGMERLSTWG